jgi:hypothetical protein
VPEGALGGAGGERRPHSWPPAWSSYGYVMLWCPFNTPAIAVGVGGGGFHGIRSVGVGAQPALSSNPALFEDGFTARVLDG